MLYQLSYTPAQHLWYQTSRYCKSSSARSYAASIRFRPRSNTHGAANIHATSHINARSDSNTAYPHPHGPSDAYSCISIAGGGPCRSLVLPRTRHPRRRQPSTAIREASRSSSAWSRYRLNRHSRLIPRPPGAYRMPGNAGNFPLLNDFAIFRASKNCFSSWFTCCTSVPLPLAIRRRRFPSIFSG